MNNKLRAYLNAMSTPDQEAFAERCGTTIGYLRKALSIGQALGEGLCMRIESASERAITCEDLRPDIAHQFQFLRDCATTR